MTGQVVVVTGGTRGVGAGIARAFLRAGAEVLVCARRPPAEPVQEAGRKAEFTSVDLRDAAAVAAFLDAVVVRHGRLDVLVNNAGGTPFRLLDGAEDTARHLRVIELNLLAPLTASLAALPHLRRSGGSVVMVGSVSGTRPSPGTAAYGAAKAGLANLAASMAVEWAPDVRVNTVVPGMVRTELSHLHYGDEAGVAAVGATVPLGRLAEPEEIGEACVFLSSPQAAYITGAALTVHGGGERPAFLAAATANTDPAGATHDPASAATGSGPAPVSAVPATGPGAAADRGNPAEP
ncbi:SDR family oxidoreductase [Streptacidiphilus jiangxiensis]|uniref:NAD(P)-dependent dehydrogenase, short-chain alcohol dehydrogenase family n=1 Tax=Streptacidiphilus jiangxiensis TaxID=235985 RepID=A0A1H7JPI6_STRJI|nr:SDR family oxidoreductase [Streptacidiphilus jiangxiensis]SEK76442.1 NAD(P)-dependent dehydrogenase, short-chain alcohol dehydrogenase family [Streptacidiphilus jiangxiensis]